MASEQFSLCWDNFHKNMSSGMNSLLENEDLVDVTLAVEGKCLKAHKMVLSVCSPYFKELFKSNPCQHPIVFMKDVSYVALSDLLQFMYQGEVQVSQENLTTFIKTAEALQIKGLTGDGNGSTDADESVSEDKTVHHQIEEYKPTPRPKKQPAPSPVVTTTPAPKRQRLSVSSESSQPLPPVITKPEPVSTPAASTTEPIQFKMEPYDQSHTLGMHDDNPDDTFGDDTLDDTNVDDTEDYSMMEGGEEEPQAGTSTDGAGEGQGFGMIVNKLLELTEQNKQIMYLLSNETTGIEIIPGGAVLADSIPFSFPLKSDAELAQLEMYLQNKDNAKVLTSYLASLGGKDTGSTTNNVMRRCLSNSLAATYNYFGKGVKRPFGCLGLRSIVVDAVRISNPQSTEKEIEGAIKVWLKHASQRLKMEYAKIK